MLQRLSAEEVARELGRSYKQERIPPSFLVMAAPGMGKTSFLEACVRALPAKTHAISVSGGVIASEGHFVRVLQAGVRNAAVGDSNWERCLRVLLARMSEAQFVIAIDDFDQLVYKREVLATTLAAAGRQGVPFVVSCAKSTASRIVGVGRPFQGILRPIAIRALNKSQADLLVQRRAPNLPPNVREFIILQAGGHPGALVYLSRIAQLCFREGATFDGERTVAHATEFAGSVYAESWSALGPQQRAILSHLSRLDLDTSSVTQIAAGILLHPSHVSAQLRRLVDEGLVRRDSRGSYSIAALLARWIVARRVWQHPLAESGTEYHRRLV